MLIDHINISAPGEIIDKVSNFYCDVFGFNVGFRPDFNSKGYWLYSDDKPQIHLTINDSASQNDNTGFLDHVAFSVTGLSQFVSNLRMCNIDYQTNYVPAIQTTQIFFRDPSGLRIEASFKGEMLETSY